MADPLREVEAALREGDRCRAREARVVVRRLRAQLVLGRDRLDRDWIWLLRRELRWVEVTIGDVADAAAMETSWSAEPLEPADHAARAELVAELTRERSRAERRLVALFDSARHQRMLGDLDRPYLRPAGLKRTLRKEWRRLESAAKPATAKAAADHELHRLGARVDRVRHGAELLKGAGGLASALGGVREALDHLEEASLAQGWLRHAAATPNLDWGLLAGQLLERARSQEPKRREDLLHAWKTADSKGLRKMLGA
ncbi:MAG: CHAD domain-containing protein [Acidimicrobiales bacterium]